jgi:hypothetical protein
MLSLAIGCMKFLMLQNRSSPFLAWANTPIINWGYSFIRYINILICTVTFVGLAYQGKKDIVFRFIIEYSSL